MNSGEETLPGGASSGGRKSAAGGRKGLGPKAAMARAKSSARGKAAAKAKKPATAKPKAAAPKKKAAAPPKSKGPKNADSTAGLPHINADAQRRAEESGPRGLRPQRVTPGKLSGGHALLHELGEIVRDWSGQAKSQRYIDWERSLGITA